MAFGGVYAFPGGGVDPSDRPETVTDGLGRAARRAGRAGQAVVGAAVRELFEEAGVLLAGTPSRPTVGGDVSGAGLGGGPARPCRTAS